MDYKKKDEDLDYLDNKPKKGQSYKTIFIAAIIIVILCAIYFFN